MFRRGARRGGRPSLLGSVARTAAVVGTAQAVSGRVAQSQANRAQTEQDAAAFRQQQLQVPAAPSADNSTDNLIDQLQKLGNLRQSGVLTDAEFEAQKARLLG
ncbi:SHOCT domain-containing protein [Nakamurella lactea]|uniref:SHOCT domain-containing protein n=1 Tax=Nakamurella lactea TaxID=459515 RepID=UPI000424061B|nr:SHOCT domain-containing protein [Nakamurella lactea]